MATQGGNSYSPHPHVIGNAFAQQYYRILNSSPEHVHKFYHDESALGRADSDGALTTVTTTDAINEYFLSTELKDCLIQLENVDTQASLVGGVFIVVTGFFTMPDTGKHRFTQSFFLAPQETGGYFVLNDVLRYVREMPSAETNEALVDHSNGNTQIAPFPVEPETTSVKESVDPELPSAENVSVNGEVINSYAETTCVDVEVINPSVENISVNNEVTDPSVESISVKDKVTSSIGNENSQVKDGVIKIPEAAPAPPASEHKDVIKKSYASIVKTKNESTLPAPITKPKLRPKPTVKRALNVEKSSSVSAKTTHASDTAPPNDKDVSDDQGYSIFVKNLPVDATAELVEAEFRKFGDIKPRGIQVVHRPVDGFCFGFVEFESQQSMYAAIEAAKIRFGTYVSYVQEKRTPKRVINNIAHSNNNGNARDSRVLPGRGGYGDNFKGQGAGFVNNGNNRDGDFFRGQGANFGNNNNYHDGENSRGRFVNSNYRDGNNMRNESRNQNEYSGRGRGLQGNDYRQNRNDYRQNRDGYNQNRDGGYKPNKEGGRQNGSGYHQPRPVQNENGNGRPGRFNGPKQPTKKKGMDAAASSSLSRKGKQEADEMAKEQAVHAEMNKVLGQAMESDAFLSKKTKALLDAAMRSMLEKKNQHSIETLPRFEIDMHCTLEELYNFIEERRFRYQMVASLQMFNEVVATPPNIHNTHQMVEVMKKLEDGKRKISVMQFIINEHDNYVGAFRPTPPGNPYQPDGFFVFKNMVNKLPEFLGTLLETGHFESYSTTTQVELRPGFLELMVQRLQESFTAKNYMKLITARNPYVEAPMILFGECQRSAEVLEAVRGSEDGPFRLITDVLDTSEAARVSHVSLALDTLFHNWSTLSKVGLWLFIAIIEFDEGLKDALRSFMEFRMQMRRCINKMSGKGPSRVDVKLYDDDGVFNLKQLLGRYLTLVKFEEALVVRCIMRTRRKFLGTYDGFALSEANIRLQHLWDTCDDDESDDEEVIENRPYRSDKIEWERWLSFRERKLRLQDEFVK